LTAISFLATNHLHRWLPATEIQKLPSFSMTEATRATIASVSVLGALHASPAVKAALADRMR
jgi:hypothetical protein